LLKRIAKVEQARPKTVLLVFILITLVMMGGFSRISTDTDQESQVPEDIEEITSLNEIRDKLSTNTNSIIIIFRSDREDPQGVSDMADRSVLQSMESVYVQMEDDDFVLGVRSLLDIVDLEMSQSEINQRVSAPDASGLITEDRSISIMIFTLPDGLTTEQEEDLTAKMREIVGGVEKPPGLDIGLSGSVVLSQELGASIGRTTGTVTLLGFVAVFGILYIFFRRPGFVFIAVTPVLLATIWTFGSLGYIGVPLSPMLSGTFSIIIGLGIDFGIHIIQRFREDLQECSIEEAIYNSVSHVGKGLLLTTATTLIGFLSLLSATLPMLQDFSVSLSLGVFFCLVSAIGFIPPVLVLVERRNKRRGK
jgi:predicted RND superfamily exporter protein